MRKYLLIGIVLIICLGVEYTLAWKFLQGIVPFPENECWANAINGFLRDASILGVIVALNSNPCIANRDAHPMDVINNYGADALRLFLATSTAPGMDLRYDEEKVAARWNFLNKLWNASRFVFLNIADLNKDNYTLDNLNNADKWIISKMNKLSIKAKLYLTFGIIMAFFIKLGNINNKGCINLIIIRF